MKNDQIETALARAACAALQDGPMLFADLVAHLLQAGHLGDALSEWHDEECTELTGDDLAEHISDDVREALLDTDEFWIDRNELISSLVAVVGAITFTHRLTADELANGYVKATIDFAAADDGLWFPRTIGLTTGGSLDLDALGPDDAGDNERYWAGPAGWLDDFEPGDLVGLRRKENEIEVSKADTVIVPPETATAFRDAFDAVKDATDLDEITFVAREALCSRPDVFTGVLAPLTDIANAAGLRCKEVWIGPAGENWHTPADAALQRQLDLAAKRNDLDACCKRALRTTVAALTDSGGSANALVAAFSHGAVLDAFDDFVDSTAADPSALDALAACVESAPVIAAHLTGIAHLQRDELHAAIDAFHRSQTLDEPGTTATVWRLVELEGARGDAPAVHRLLKDIEATGAESDAVRAIINGSKDVGRNDPCPCGSGRKYKACCQGKPNQSEVPEGDGCAIACCGQRSAVTAS